MNFQGKIEEVSNREDSRVVEHSACVEEKEF